VLKDLESALPTIDRLSKPDPHGSIGRSSMQCQDSSKKTLLMPIDIRAQLPALANKTY
jgi:hypothetical protein